MFVLLKILFSMIIRYSQVGLKVKAAWINNDAGMADLQTMNLIWIHCRHWELLRGEEKWELKRSDILIYTKFNNLSISNINIRSIQNRNLKNAEGSCNVRKMNRYFILIFTFVTISVWKQTKQKVFHSKFYFHRFCKQIKFELYNTVNK